MKEHGIGGGEIRRRDILKALGAAGAAAALPTSELFGQFVNKSTAKGGRIDVHHHHVPPGLGGFGGAGGAGGLGRGGFGGGRVPWTPEKTLEQMGKFDIAGSILSMTQMGEGLYDNTEKGRKAVRT